MAVALSDTSATDGSMDTGDNDTCLQLALEGEKLCKAGNCRDGVAFFEAALQAGTDDFRTLSAIYSQLGNAYFYMGDYVKAMQYHKHDLTLARTMGDRLGEAKASGNLGNTLKVMGKFEEAVICCRRHLEICQEHGDRIGIGRALYNLGNVYHAKGKHIGRLGHQDPGEFPEEVKALFEKAVQYYEQNTILMKEIGDKAAQGRACGNLGNVHYLLGNFSLAIHYHNERLKIAKEFGDKAAERRAHSNLGNAHIFLGEFERAAEQYKRTLHLAQELGDRAVEAQACYSLGNTYTLLKDYAAAIKYHMRHLAIAQELFDKVGEGRACWSLGNAHSAMGQHKEAYHYAMRHLEISRDTGDTMGQTTAQMNLNELSRTLGYPEANAMFAVEGQTNKKAENPQQRRVSMEHMDLIKMTPDVKNLKSSKNSVPAPVAPSSSKVDGKENKNSLNKSGLEDEEDFFDFLTRFQSKRMDDQRCSLVVGAAGATNRQPPPAAAKKAVDRSKSKPMGDLLDMIGASQHHHQNAAKSNSNVPFLPGLMQNKQSEVLQQLSAVTAASSGEQLPDDSFFETLMKCQGSRIEEQRSSLPNNRPGDLPPHAPTVPDEDFFSLIHKLQGSRLEDQRASLPKDPARK